jgi:hypothetical protein
MPATVLAVRAHCVIASKVVALGPQRWVTAATVPVTASKSTVMRCRVPVACALPSMVACLNVLPEVVVTAVPSATVPLPVAGTAPDTTSVGAVAPVPEPPDGELCVAATDPLAPASAPAPSPPQPANTINASTPHAMPRRPVARPFDPFIV